MGETHDRQQTQRAWTRLAAITACIAAWATAPAMAQGDDGWLDPGEWTKREQSSAGAAISVDYDAYYNGYYDGFHDNAFGYDYIGIDRTDAYAASYRDGYYDGYYDQSRGYELQPYYYLFEQPLGEEDASDARRNDPRQRGDREPTYSNSSAAMQQRRQAWEERGIRRVRGTVAAVERADLGGRHANHITLQVRFVGGETALVDLGDQLTRNPLDEGDRVTFQGSEQSIDGRRFLAVNRLTVDGRRLQVRGRESDAGDSGDGRRDGDDFWNDDDGRRDAEPGRRADRDTRDPWEPEPTRPSTRTLRGEIQSWRWVELDARPDRRILRLALENGRTHLIDLGADIRPWRVDLQQGDRVEISGPSTWVDGDLIMDARSFWIDGRDLLE